MITKSYILENLKTLDRSYAKASSARKSLFYSKLAILELCGWIEESMDDVILRCARRHLKNNANVKFVRKEIVQRTYGFDYERHFRSMLIQLLGLINVEKIEKSVDQRKHIQLKATLKALKTVRDSEAHTHIKGVTRSINAPSATLNQFPALYDGLMEYDRTIGNTRF